MKKKVVIRTVVSKPPTDRQIEWYYRELSKIIEKYYFLVDDKEVIKRGDSIYILQGKRQNTKKFPKGK